MVTDTEELSRLRDLIRKVRDERGDDRCWLSLRELYAALPEGYDPPARDCLVDIAYCKWYILSCHMPGVEYVSPQREIDFLRVQIDKQRETIIQLADRCFAQHELLDSRAEKKNDDTDPPAP